MQVAKVTSKGQITLPIQIRRTLKVKEGDNVIFMPNTNGSSFIVANASEGYFVLSPSVANKLEFDKMKENFSEAADRYGLKTIDDVVTMVKETRAEN